MPETLLLTKFYIPRPRPNLVPRPRLVDRLNRGLQQGNKLTLISAPAGFGKSTLVSEWVSQQNKGEGIRGDNDITIHPASLQQRSEQASIVIPHKVAWLSIDEDDSQLSRFITYLVAALQTIAADIGISVLSALQSAQPPGEPLLAILVNEIALSPEHIILVLDDFHQIRNQAIHEILAFLIDHQPPQMHLVIVTREDPHLPLARLRARGQMTELRVTDLRFTQAEAGGFLNQMMGLDLSVEEIVALGSRTEGWITGLQLAALALQGQISAQGKADPATFIKAFAGHHHFILDYLVEEVLSSLPKEVHSFLLQTCFLEKLCSPLCNAVRFGPAEKPSAQDDSRAMLAALERDNLFVIPLDDQRVWFRYHHLFADVLQARALEELPDLLPVLHRRASTWYEQNDLLTEAIHHAFAAGEIQRAAGLIELTQPHMDWSFQSSIWLGWVKALPNDVVQNRPVLCVGYAMALLDTGQLSTIEVNLKVAEGWLAMIAVEDGSAKATAAGMVVVDEAQLRSLPARIATIRAALARARGDLLLTITYARQACELSPEDDYFERGRSAAVLGLVLWELGDLSAAHQTFTEFMSNMRSAGNLLVAISGTFLLADIRMIQGRLQDAITTYRHSLALVHSQEGSVLRGTADLHVGLAEGLCEAGDLAGAREQLRLGEGLGDQGMLPELQHRSNLARARIKAVQGDLDGALDLYSRTEQLTIPDGGPDVRPLAALKARMWVRQGRLKKAHNWANTGGLSANNDLTYLREFEHITLARLLLACYKHSRQERYFQEVLGFLERMLPAAEAGERIGSVIEILILQALTLQAGGRLSAALASIERALTLAEPQGYVPMFVEEGTPMAQLLIEAVALGITPEYCGRLLNTVTAGVQSIREPIYDPPLPPSSPPIDPLTMRELDVLRLLNTELSGPEIARELVIAISTFRSHTKSIYGKLDVTNRRAAVNRARELGLI